MINFGLMDRYFTNYDEHCGCPLKLVRAEVNSVRNTNNKELICFHIGNFLYYMMRIIAVSKLREFWDVHPDAMEPLNQWFRQAKASDWNSPDEVIHRMKSTRVLNAERITFNIKGNSYRLITAINYSYKIVYIRFIGTHAEYDRINAKEI